MVTMVERIPELAADEPAKVRSDDDLILQFGSVPERVTSPPFDEQLSPAAADWQAAPAAEASTGTWYVVKRGDTLSSIALEHLGSMSRAKDLARLNGISNPDQLEAGDRIRLR